MYGILVRTAGRQASQSKKGFFLDLERIEPGPVMDTKDLGIRNLGTGFCIHT